MKKQTHQWLLLTIILATFGWSGSALGVELYFSPQDQNIALGGEGSLGIMLDEPLNVRTIELTIGFSSFLEVTAGGAGAAFQDLPCYVWEELEDQEGQWYAFAVSIGSDCFVTGPGELFTFTFTGLSNGTAQINVISIMMYDDQGDVIPDVTLPGTTVVVGTGISPVDPGGPRFQPEISASPNPCNPRTVLKFWLPEARQADLAVFDVRGHKVRQLLAGPVADQWTSVPWDGRTDDGQAAPSGVYLYRLQTPFEQLSGRITLAR